MPQKLVRVNLRRLLQSYKVTIKTILNYTLVRLFFYNTYTSSKRLTFISEILIF